MADMARWIAWAEGRIARVVIREQLHMRCIKATQGPLTITLQARLLRPSPTDLRKVLSLGPALAQALGVEAVRVTDTARGILFELPSPQPHTPAAALLAGQTAGLKVAVGLDQWRKPVHVDLAQHGGLLWVGPSRRGKTESLKSTVYALAQANAWHRVQYLVLSQKRPDWAAFAPAAGCLGVISDPAEARRALRWVTGSLLAGRAAQGGKTPAVLVVVDDLLNLLEREPGIAGSLAEIASMGAGLGVHLLAGTQEAGSKRGTGGTAVESNCTCRILYKASSAAAAARAAGQGGAGVDQLTGARGDALLIVDGEPVRLATGYADDREIGRLESGCVAVAPWLDMQVDTVDMPYPDQGGYTRLYPGDLPLQNGHGGHWTDNGRGAEADIHFPLGEARPLTLPEQEEVRRLSGLDEFQYRGALSLNRLTVHVYGSKNPQRADWIRAALSGQEEETPQADSFEVWDLNTAEGRAALSALQKAGTVTWRPADPRFRQENGQ